MSRSDAQLPRGPALLHQHGILEREASSPIAGRRFFSMSHDYYQPEMITEEQVAQGALQHYNALYVVDPYVSRRRTKLPPG